MSAKILNDDTYEDDGVSLDESDVPVRAISEVGLNRMAKQREDVSTQMAGAVQKIESLQSRQHDLEREKRELQELTRKQEEYETGKREIVDKIGRCLILVDKEETQAGRMVELLGETRQRFKETLAELKNIDESRWQDEKFDVELDRALVKVDIAKTTYKKAMAKIDASSWHKEGEQSEVQKQAEREVTGEKGFCYWLKVGVAISLPVIVVMVCIFVAWLMVTGRVPL
jgi:hypothetical protein